MENISRSFDKKVFSFGENNLFELKTPKNCYNFINLESPDNCILEIDFDQEIFSFGENNLLELNTPKNYYNFVNFEDPDNCILEIDFDRKDAPNNSGFKQESNGNFALASQRITDSEPFYILNQRAKHYFAYKKNPYYKFTNSDKLFVIHNDNDILYIALFLLLASFSMIGLLFV